MRHLNYKKAFNSIKMQIAGIYLESISKETNLKQIQEEIYNVWKRMNELERILDNKF